jgi:hypothetical protein
MNEPTIRAIDRKEWLPWHYVNDQGTAFPVDRLQQFRAEPIVTVCVAVRVARFAIMRALMK